MSEKYISTTPCKICGSYERYRSTRACVACALIRAELQLEEDPEGRHKSMSAWKKKNPDYRVTYTRAVAALKELPKPRQATALDLIMKLWGKEVTFAKHD